MKRALISSIATAALIIAAVSFTPAVSRLSAAQRGTPATAAPAPKATPRTADGHPDLSGVWWRGGDVGGRGFNAGAPGAGRGGRGAAAPPPSYTSLYNAAAQEKLKKLGDKDDPTLRCVPTSFGTLNVGMFGVGAVAQIVQTPKFVILLTETFHSWKIVPIDGRAHRDDVPPAYRGDSVIPMRSTLSSDITGPTRTLSRSTPPSKIPKF
jgi:hypothetical protein